MTTIDQLGGTEHVKDNDLIPIFQRENRRTRNVSAIDLAEYVNQSAAVVSVDGRTGEVTLADKYAPILHVGSTGTGQHGLVTDNGAAGFMSGAQSAKLTGIQAAAQNNTASNVGAGAQVFQGKTGSNLAFRTIAAGSSNVTVTQNADDIAISVQSSDQLNTLRVNVASASTVNLTTAAPNTRHINITGTTTINGFTVAAGQVYFVRFADRLTLTNGASIGTNRSANVETAAGDTCIIRANAANAVEVLCGNFLSEAAVGTRGQTWQDVTSSRVGGTVYTNTTGRPIQLLTSSPGATSPTLTIATQTILYIIPLSVNAGFSAIIPAGATYSISVTQAKWLELR
jgi:hypothetical protein